MINSNNNNNNIIFISGPYSKEKKKRKCNKKARYDHTLVLLISYPGSISLSNFKISSFFLASTIYSCYLGYLIVICAFALHLRMIKSMLLWFRNALPVCCHTNNGAYQAGI